MVGNKTVKERLATVEEKVDESGRHICDIKGDVSKIKEVVLGLQLNGATKKGQSKVYAWIAGLVGGGMVSLLVAILTRLLIK